MSEHTMSEHMSKIDLSDDILTSFGEVPQGVRESVLKDCSESQTV
jgi:hypothetical protein